MKKAFIIIAILACGFGAYLFYDWHVKAKEKTDEQGITLYSWTESKGAKHFTDKPPPKGAKNVKETKGHKFVESPLVVKIKDKTIEYYKWIRNKLFNG